MKCPLDLAFIQTAIYQKKNLSLFCILQIDFLSLWACATNYF